MSDTYYVKTFGGLEITNDNVTVNIVELFGKQLVNLLQVLLFHSEKPVQKDELNDIFLSELGTGLSKRFKQLYDIIIADHAKEESKNMETIMRELSSRDQQNQGFFCSYEIFKYFYELLLKMSIRNEQNYYLIMLQFSDGTLDYEKIGLDFDRVKRLVGSCLRSNDLFTRTSETQLLLLVDCQTEENAHLIIQRISNKFYSIFRKKNYRMNYSVHKAELDRNN